MTTLQPITARPQPSAEANVRWRRTSRSRAFLVMLACLAALGFVVGIRLYLLVGSGWLLEGDDSLSTLMALAVVQGDRPIMLKNQTYAAAWEPYAMAVSYTLFGVSRVSAKLPALLGSLALILTTCVLARQAAGRAAGWFAAALAAVPPSYVLVLTLKPWAPYTEVILFGSLCLASAIRLAWPPAFASTRDARWSFACGLSGGLALWMHPLAVWYLGAAALTLLVRVRPPRWPTLVSWGVAGFLIGGLPIWLFQLQTGGATVRFIASGTQGQTADRWAVLGAWWTNDLPRGAGLWQPWGESPPWLAALMAALIALSIVWAAIGRRAPRLRPLDSVVVLLVLMPTLLVLSGFGGPALNPWGFDATGRYTPPLWFALAVVLGAALGALWRARRLLAVTLCALAIGVNVAAVAATDPVAAFQSPYWNKLPVDNSQLLGVLREEDVRFVWMNHWAGKPVMFDARIAGQPLVAYDWYDVQAGGIDRFPELRPLVEQAERPGFVLVTDEREPALQRELRQMGISFVERRAPPYVVVIPTSRIVHPSEVTSALDYRY